MRKSGCVAVCAGAAILLCGCANIGNPEGGPRDETPPVFTGSDPVRGSVDVKRNKITLRFDELVNVKDAMQNVVVSPPSARFPRITSLGRRVTVEFDSLKPGTTYTIDFADAIEDVREGNALNGFAYTFSTGPVLDSLRISGYVLEARDMEPRQGMLVGVYADTAGTADSVFHTQPMLRVAKTDDRGRFTVRGLAPGSYRVVALQDNENDFKYSSPEEDIAFLGELVVPGTEETVALDTLYDTRSGKMDTVVERRRTRFLPNDLLLRSFNSGKRPQFITKSERTDSTRVFLKFNVPLPELPEVSVLSPRIAGRGNLWRLEANEKRDSLVYWLEKPLVATDSLTFAISYPDGAEIQIDTLDFNTRRYPVKKPKGGKKQKVNPLDSIAAITTAFKVVQGSEQDVWRPLEIEVPAPLARLDTSALRLEVKRDTVYVPVSGEVAVIRGDSLSPRKFGIRYAWDYASDYRLVADTLAGTDIYGKATRPLVYEFRTKKEGDYCSLLLHVRGVPPGVPAFVELLNGSDKPVRTGILENGDVLFRYLPPGRYYARLVEDLNGNGEYDSGDYDAGRQPEVAYYYPKALNIKKNWDKEETWDLFATAVDLMKPEALKKNKPKATRHYGNGPAAEEDEEDDDYFDPTRNPFDKNDRGRRKGTPGSY